MCKKTDFCQVWFFVTSLVFFLGFLWFLFVFCIFNMILHLEITNLHESFGYWYSFKNSLTTFKKKLDINHLHIFLKCKSICHTDLYIYQNLFIIILKYYFQSEFIFKWDKHYQKTYYLSEEFNYQSLSDETFIKEVLWIMTFSVDDKRPTRTLAFLCLKTKH